MRPEIIRLATLALVGAALAALAALPRLAHGGEAATDAHEVPPFAKSRTEIVQQAPAAEASR
jgi:hypothetical protein